MRIGPFLLLLALLAAPAGAQQLPAGHVPATHPAAGTLQAETSAPAAHEARAEEARTAPPPTPTQQLDDAFWRSVLAGILVTVISALILRAIL